MTGRLLLTGLWRGARAGLVAGTMYFLVLAVLVVFGAALGSGTASLPWLVLFVGAGAGCGLVLGALAGSAVAMTVGLLRTRSGSDADLARPTAGSRERVVGAVVAGVVVATLCLAANVTGVPGVLTPEPMTSVALPTLVAAWGGAALVPRLRRARPAVPA